MAITFFKGKREKQLAAVLLVILLFGVLFVIWQFFLAKPPPLSLPISKPSLIEIDFELLKSPLLENLIPFEKIPPLEEAIGRENPFVPY